MWDPQGSAWETLALASKRPGGLEVAHMPFCRVLGTRDRNGTLHSVGYGAWCPVVSKFTVVGSDGSVLESGVRVRAQGPTMVMAW